jgi:predicted transcriptional regulator
MQKVTLFRKPACFLANFEDGVPVSEICNKMQIEQSYISDIIRQIFVPEKIMVESEITGKYLLTTKGKKLREQLQALQNLGIE